MPLWASVRGMVLNFGAHLILWPIQERPTELVMDTIVAEGLEDPVHSWGATVIMQSHR